MATFFPAGTARDAKAVTPNDSTDLSNGTCQALYIGTAGDVSVITDAGTTLTIKAADSTTLQLQVKRVRSTGTTATEIIALY